MRYIPEETVRLSDKIAYCIGAIGKDLVHGIVAGCIFIYCMQILGIEFSFLSSTFIISLLCESLTAPFIGVLIDNSRSVLHRYKFWVMLGSCLNMLFLTTIFFAPAFGTQHIEYFIAFAFILWSISFNFIDLPYWAIVSSFNYYATTRNAVASIPCISRHVGLQCFSFLLMTFFARQNGTILYLNHETYLFVAMGAILTLFATQVYFIFILHSGTISTSYTPDYRKDASFDGEIEEITTPEQLKESNCCTVPTPHIQLDHLDLNDPSANFAILNANRRALNPYPEDLNTSRLNSHGLSSKNFGGTKQQRARPFLHYSEGKSSTSILVDSAEEQSKLTLKSFFNVFFRNDQLLVICATDMILHITFSLIFSSLALFFLEKHISQQPAVLALIVIGAFIQLMSMGLFNTFVQRTTRSIVFISSIVLVNGGFALLLMIQNTYSLSFYIILALCIFSINIGIGLIKVALTSMTADTVDYGEFKMSLRLEGIVFAASTMASRLGLTFALFIYFFSTHSLGEWVLHIPNISHITWLNLATTAALSTVLSFLTLLLYINFYKLNGAFYRNILNNLQFLRLNQRTNENDPQTFMLRYSLDTSTMFIKLKARNQDELIHAMVQKLVEVNALSSEHEYMKDLQNRLDLSPCGIAEGIAIPHAKSDSVRRATVVVATLDNPIDLGAFDGQNCDLIFLLASPDDGITHLNILGRLSLLLNEPGFADKLRTAGSPTELFDRLVQCEKHIMH